MIDLILILLTIWLPAVAEPFEIQVFDGHVAVMPPYRLISGKSYRLQAVASDEIVEAKGPRPYSAEWFLTGNLGRITTGNQPTLTAVFVGEGGLICRVNGMERRVQLSVVPVTKTIDSNGGTLQSPIGVEISFPEGALAIEQKIGIEIVPSPGLPAAAQRFVHVVRISPQRLVLKRPCAADISL